VDGGLSGGVTAVTAGHRAHPSRTRTNTRARWIFRLPSAVLPFPPRADPTRPIGGTDPVISVDRGQNSPRTRAPVGARTWPAAAFATAALAAALGAGTWFAWWFPLALVVGFLVLLAAIAWMRWIAVRDARAVIVLWLVSALNRPIALVVPEALRRSVLYLDDIALASALAVLLLTGVRLVPATRSMAVAYLGFGLFLVSGVVGAVLAGTSLTVTALGTWLALKLFVYLLITTQFHWTERDLRLAARAAAALIVLVLSVAALQWVAPGPVSTILGVEQRTRLGQGVISSIFVHPGQYSTFMMFALALLLARYPLTPRRMGSVLVVGAAAMLSLRLKSLVDVVLLTATRVAISPSKFVKAGAPVVLLSGVTAAALFGSALVSARVGDLFVSPHASPREVLYVTSARIAQDFFPFGGGFGSFGSAASLIEPSPLYSEYGLTSVYGLSPDAPLFVHDASWATTLGEGGLLGAAGLLLAMGALLVTAWKRAHVAGSTRKDQAARATLLFAVAFLNDSLSTTQLFVGFSCLTLAVLLSISLDSSTPAPPKLGREAKVL
jgi:hypothetical protein